MKIESNISSVNISPPTSMRTTTLPTGEFKQRDVVIINPYTDGGGDIVLGNKIANIALHDGCRVSILSMDNCNWQNQSCRNLSLKDNQPHDISHLHNPIFIVAPTYLIPLDILQSRISKLCSEQGFKQQDILLIEEMDVLAKHDVLPRYTDELAKSGFENIKAYHLGFQKGIGYLATDKHQIDTIKQRFECELTKLMDSYNVTLMKNDNYHLGYTSSNTPIDSTQSFLANSLIETQHDNKNTTYFIVARTLDETLTEQYPVAIQSILSHHNGIFNYPALFSTMQLYFLGSQTGNLTKSISLSGTGKRHINIVITQSLPKNIFDDVMCLAHSGMMSGDQSLSEYLSLKGTVPYYEMQPWKTNVAKGLHQHWAKYAQTHRVKHKILGKYLDKEKVVSTYPFLSNENYQPLSISERQNDDQIHQKIANQTANDKIREFITPRDEWEKWDQWKANQ